MSAEGKIEKLLENVTNALNALNKCDSFDELSRTDWTEIQNLEQFKNIVSDILTKAEHIKLAINNVYERLETTSNSSVLANEGTEITSNGISDLNELPETDDNTIPVSDKIEKPIRIRIKNRRIVTNNEESSANIENLSNLDNENAEQVNEENESKSLCEESEDLFSSSEDVSNHLPNKNKSKKNEKKSKSKRIRQKSKHSEKSSAELSQKSGSSNESDTQTETSKAKKIKNKQVGEKENPQLQKVNCDSDLDQIDTNSNPEDDVDLGLEKSNNDSHKNPTEEIGDNGEEKDAAEEMGDTAEKKDSTEEIGDTAIEKDATEKIGDTTKEKDATKEIGDTANTKEFIKPIIKLVDIKKLMAPGAKPISSPQLKESVQFDSSVIVLTSSDEDLSTKHTNNKDSVSTRENRPKRSSRNKSTSLKETVEIDSSDSDSEIPRRRTRRSDKKAIKARFDKLVNERSRRTRRKNLKLDSDSDSEESKTANKKNGRKGDANSTNRTEKKNLKSKDNSNSGSESEETSNIATDKTKKSQSRQRKKKELLEERSLSECTDESDTVPLIEKVAKKDTLKAKSTKETERDQYTYENDIKFKSKVYIPLPKFKCENLPDLYLHKKELLEIKRLAKMDFVRKSRPKPRQKVAFQMSSDEESDLKSKTKENKKNKCEKSKLNSESDGENKETTEAAIDEEKSNSDSDGKNVEADVAMADVLNEKQSETLAEVLMERKDETDEEPQKVDGDNEESNKNANDIEQCSQSGEENTNEIEDEESRDNKKRKRKDNDSSDEADKTKNAQKSKWKKDKLLTEKIDTSDSEGEKDKPDSKDKSIEEVDKKSKKKKVISDSESDHEDNQSEPEAKASNSNESEKEVTTTKKLKKKTKKKIISDSESDYEAECINSNKSSESETEKVTEKEPAKKAPARKRIKRTRDSSSSDEDKTTRKTIRKVLDKDSLSETTKQAEADEKERKARIAEKQKKYNQIFQLKSDAVVDKVILDFDEEEGKELLCVNKKLVSKLKPHQVNGVKFMWDACFESIERVKKSDGSGCILAHCMGLGKTLQVITLSHTLLTNSKKTKVEKIMVVCPVNTVLNWKAEFKKWLPKEDFEVYDLVSCKTSSVYYERSSVVRDWHEDGGVLILGYNMFRNLSNPDYKAIPKKLRKTFQEGLVDPGPDLVVCDEGHLLKNEKTNLSMAMNRIKTARRIVLTGTPLQNNLKEYWCMVQFIKPNLLGTYKEYLNRFVNPIINGQYTDSTPHDISVMRKRSHVLHKLLDGVVQRQDYAVLAPYLPPKYEYVVFIKLTEMQAKLYMHYMKNLAQKRSEGSRNTSFLFTDFQALQRICTHPRVLLDKSIEDKDKKLLADDDEEDSEGSLKDFINDGTSDEESMSSSTSGSNSSGSESDSSIKKKKKKGKNKTPPAGRLTRAQRAQKRDNGNLSDSDIEMSGPKEWWQEIIDGDELDNINHSSKLFLLFKILKECEEIGDKVLVFSQSLYTLNCIEYFLQKADDASQSDDAEKIGGHTGSWSLGLDYFRLDGSSSCDNRAAWCDSFNNPDNTRARLFLISTKAGGLGINLVAANRVIIFDVSWNPSHDIQSIYRVYRFGQTKPCYVYRFVCYGTMEMKIYERQVTKQAISKRVIDEQQIDRHYSQNDIMELYTVDLDPKDRPIPLVPKDVLLGELLQKHEETIFKYHEHQSLLENKEEECLNEEERKAAWEEFENEKVLRKSTVTNLAGISGNQPFNTMAYSPQMLQVALANIVRKDNPSWSEIQIKGILPALVQQLQMQMSEQDYTMYNRVQQEIKLMQAVQAQRMREQYFQHQIQQMIQKQQLQNQMLGNLNVNPSSILSMHLQNVPSQSVSQPRQNSVRASRKSKPKQSEVIELND